MGKLTPDHGHGQVWGLLGEGDIRALNGNGKKYNKDFKNNG